MKEKPLVNKTTHKQNENLYNKIDHRQYKASTSVNIKNRTQAGKHKLAVIHEAMP